MKWSMWQILARPVDQSRLWYEWKKYTSQPLWVTRLAALDLSSRHTQYVVSRHWSDQSKAVIRPENHHITTASVTSAAITSYPSRWQLQPDLRQQKCHRSYIIKSMPYSVWTPCIEPTNSLTPITAIVGQFSFLSSYLFKAPESSVCICQLITYACKNSLSLKI